MTKENRTSLKTSNSESRSVRAHSCVHVQVCNVVQQKNLYCVVKKCKISPAETTHTCCSLDICYFSILRECHTCKAAAWVKVSFLFKESLRRHR